MNAETSTNTKTERGLTIVRRFEAPRELVFRAWTEPEHLSWFAGSAPPAHPTTVDLRVGGAWRFHMIENEERSYTTGGIYREIVPPEKLVFMWGAVGGWPSFDPDRPEESAVVTITFNDIDGATEMVFVFEFPDHFSEETIREWFAKGIFDGWTQTIDRLTDPVMLGDHS